MVFPVVLLDREPVSNYCLTIGVNCFMADDRSCPALAPVSGTCQATHRTAWHAGGRWAVINENLLNSDM